MDGTTRLCDIAGQIEREARPVLDAGGVPVKIGDVVWGVDGSGPFKVGLVVPDDVTHVGPVLAADGRLLREGEEVFVNTENPCESGLAAYERVTVEEVSPSGVFVSSDSKRCGRYVLPSQLTHAVPATDSWEDIDDDLTRPPGAYCAIRGIDLGDDPDRETATVKMARDLVRRARGLAERGER